MSNPRAPGRSLGVLGGMGPAAAADFLLLVASLSPAASDQGHFPLVHYSDPQTPDRSDAIRGLGPDPLPKLLSGVRFLDQVGCSVIAIPCNSAHYWFDQLQAAVSIPILHIVDATVASLGQHAPSECLGVLTTEGVLEAGTYAKRLAALGHVALVPDPHFRYSCVAPAIHLAKSGDLSGARDLLLPAVDHLFEGGASRVILGCTDISAALRPDHASKERPLIDASDALARAVLQWFNHHP